VIVNLYVDRFMVAQPTTATEIWSATREESKFYTQAAHRLGLSDSQYHEFRSDLLEGKALYVKLPRRLDAMSGIHEGRIYVVKNARLTSRQMGWKVALADGTDVYVPQACGNLSLIRKVQAAPRLPHHFVAAVAHMPPAETPVSLTPPPPQLPIAAESSSGAVVPVASSSRGFAALPGIVAGVIGGILGGFSGGGGGGSACPAP
jgi:hypothetical protein